MTSALLYAAGFGTRMRHLTADQPKPLVRVAGKALIDHALDQFAGEEITKTVVNLHYRGDMIRAHLAGLDIAFSPEDTIRDTGGGLKHALPLLGTGPVITMNTDAVWAGPKPVAILRSAWRDEMECLVMIAPKDRAIGHLGQGDFLTDAAGRVTRGPGGIYTGLQMIRTDRFARTSDAVFGTMMIWEQMIAAGTLWGVQYPGAWCDVGQPESIPLAETMLADAHV